MAWFLIFLGLVATIAAVQAWMGSRRWWIGQVAALAAGVVLPVVILIGMALYINWD